MDQLLYELLRRAGAWWVRDQDHFDLLVDQFEGQGIRSGHVTVGEYESVFDIGSFHAADIAHALLEGLMQMIACGYLRKAQGSDTTDGCGGLSAAERVCDEQADANCQ